MARARRLHIDHPMERRLLSDGAARRSMRVMLYRQAMKMGRVDASTIRYGLDPHDGPLAEREGLPNDELAVIRFSAMVEPFDS